MTIKKPMLAVAGDDHQSLAYPRLASPKLDGIRALTHPELGLVSRTFKPIPNEYIRKSLNYVECSCLDGELITYNEDGTMRTFNETQGDVMRKEGTPIFQFHVFDDFTDPDAEFITRYAHCKARTYHSTLPFIQHVLHDKIDEAEELEALRDEFLYDGFEGLMTRTFDGKYKQGRSTVKQGWLLKHKVWHDDEALLVDIEEKMRNENVATTGEVGQTKRSSAKAGLVPAGTTGALVLRHPTYGEFRCGTGFDDDLASLIWNRQEHYLGQLVKFKCQLEGAKDKPRFPVFLGFRHKDDM